MKSNTLFAPAAGLIALLPSAALAQAESTGLLTFFLPGSQPMSLEASAVAVDTAGPTPVTTLEIDCPKAASPDNNACRAMGIYPARVHHTQGSVWGGTTTAATTRWIPTGAGTAFTAATATTTWECTLQGNPPSQGAEAECTSTIFAENFLWALGATMIDRIVYGSCHVAAHQRPVVVTAGVDKINSAHYLTMDAGQYVTAQNSVLSAAGCPAVSSLDSPSTTRTTMGTVATTAGTSSGSGDEEATTTPPPTGTETEEDLPATTSPNGAGRLGTAPMAALLVGFVAMVGAV